jgi:rubrerythrin
MRDRLKTLLETIVDDETIEAKWLNTLSLLEYIGARKIGRTMCREHPSAVVLDHWADETRHAYAFKQLCETVSGGPSQAYLCKEPAVHYFQHLDERASRWISEATGKEDPRQNYLLVTTLVERRAMMVYPLYRAATHLDVVRDELQVIIVEEQDHRVEIEERATAYLDARGVDIEEAFGLEQDLFGGLIAKMADELGVDLG